MIPAPAIEVFDPMDPRVLKHPYAAYRWLRDQHPVAYLEPLDIWVLSRYADARDVLAAPESFSAALAFGRDSSVEDSRRSPHRRLNLKFAGDAGGVISSTDGAAHARLRRMVARILSKPRLDAAERAIRDHADRLIAELTTERREFDVVDDLAKPVATRAIGDVMGLSPRVSTVLGAWVDLTFRSLDPGDELSTIDAGPRMMRSNLVSVRAVTDFLKAGTLRTTPDEPNGLVEAWREASTAGEREEVILSVLQLFQAGYETIVSAISSIMVTFVIDQSRPWVYTAGSDVLASVIEEGLRLASPVRSTFRVAVGQQVVGGVPVPDGARLMVLLGSANRDERVFDDPDEARPGRPTAHIAFGGGPHRCLGRALAHLELTHVLRALASSTRSLSAIDGARVCANILKAGYDHLPVRVD